MHAWQGSQLLAIDEARAGLDDATSHWPEEVNERIGQAVQVAIDAHADQQRRSGEPYVCHPIEVARIVAQVGGEPDTVIAAVLHDTVEDTHLTLAEISDAFGPEVAALVDGCTKVDAARASTPSSLEAARLRKLLVAMANDPRVLVVKLADRLHNMRTIGSLSPEKQQRIGKETLAVHGPLAHRLGLAALKAELEDRAFAAADPDRYASVRATLNESSIIVEMQDARHELSEHLADAGLSARVHCRVKHAWSAAKKADRLGIDVTELHDLVGLRLIVDTPQECYLALGVVHALWPPVPGHIKDYIARPKFNSYQSLHTVVARESGMLLEVQIRTGEMHSVAERGQAAHHAYKHPDADEPAWLTRLLDWHGETSDDAYLAGVHAELRVDEEIYVVTPAGDVLTLPSGATAVDFAYAVHTDVGNGASAAEVNGRVVPLSTVLRSGDRVVITSQRADGPDAGWLEFTVTPKARSRIRQWHQRLRREQARDRGEALVRAHAESLGVAGAEIPAWKDAPQVADRYELVGRGSLPAGRVLEQVRRQEPGTDAVLKVSSDPSMEVRMAGCCRPANRELVTGALSASKRHVVAHTAACPNLLSLLGQHPDRQVRVRWVAGSGAWTVLEVIAENRTGLLADVASALTSAGGDIESSSTDVHDDGTCREVFEVSHPGVEQADLTRAVAAVDGIVSIRCW